MDLSTKSTEVLRKVRKDYLDAKTTPTIEASPETWVRDYHTIDIVVLKELREKGFIVTMAHDWSRGWKFTTLGFSWVRQS